MPSPAASQAPLAAKRPEGRWLSAVFQVSNGVLDVAAMIGLQFRVSPSRSVMKP